MNTMAPREVPQSFSLSETETSMECKFCHAHAQHESLMWQRVAMEDAPEMAHLLDAKRENVEHIIEEQQAYRAQVVALSQIQLQAMQKLEEQEKELQRFSILLLQHQAVLQTF